MVKHTSMKKTFKLKRKKDIYDKLNFNKKVLENRIQGKTLTEVKNYP